jgi:hypothetical protein
MQKRAQEVALAVTSHNQKQQQEQCKRQTQTPANRPQEVVHCKPKTTTHKIKVTKNSQLVSHRLPTQH